MMCVCVIKYHKDTRILTMALSNDNLKIFPGFMLLSYFINFVISKFCMECLILFKPNSLHKFTFLYVVFSQTELFPLVFLHIFHV